MSYTRVAITEAATSILDKLKAKHGDLIFHQSGGCCDGSSPMVFEEGDMYLDESDILLGQLDGINYYMNQDQFSYWKPVSYTHLTLPTTPYV